MFSDNKYTIWYFSIISMASEREVLHNQYMERHHVIPKSIGGSDTADNLVSLTAKEHFVCHHLLTKMVEDPILKQKMYFAFVSMSRSNQNHSRTLINANTYSRMKALRSTAMVLMWQDPERLLAASHRQKEKFKDAEFIANFRQANARYWANSANVESHKRKLVDYWSNQENRNAASSRQLELNKNPEIRAKKANCGEKNGMYGKRHTEEARQAMSAPRSTKGKTYEELYGKEKAYEMKKQRSERMKETRRNKTK